MSNSNLDNSETKEVDINYSDEKAKKSVVAGDEVVLQDDSSADVKVKKMLNKK